MLLGLFGRKGLVFVFGGYRGLTGVYGFTFMLLTNGLDTGLVNGH